MTKNVFKALLKNTDLRAVQMKAVGSLLWEILTEDKCLSLARLTRFGPRRTVRAGELWTQPNFGSRWLSWLSLRLARRRPSPTCKCGKVALWS